VTTETNIAELITRRDELKSAGHNLHRHEIASIVGAITEALHEPFKIESERLAQMRSEIVGELTRLNHLRAGQRNAHMTAQSLRATMLAAGEDASEHTSCSKAAFVELRDTEDAIADLETRIRGVDAQLVALTVAEGAQMITGLSAS
jgi:hypothetical protein